MALLLDARLRAIDSNGNPLNAATLTIYTAGTTTPASIYSDYALTVPLSTPTSDAGGWFPQIYAAEATLVDITLKDSGGATVKTYTNVTFLGADTGTFSRTLSGNTRFKISDSAGVVLMEFGDASPDNVGGTAKLQGWAGTQADLITVNATLVNVVGRIKENSHKLPGIVYSETAFSALASVDIPLTQYVTGLRAWMIHVYDLQVSLTTGNLCGLLSYDGGSTFKSGASDYHAYVKYSTTETSSLNWAQMQFSTGTETATNKNTLMRLEMITPNSGSDASIVYGTVSALNDGSTSATVHTSTNFGVGGYGRATHLRLYNSSGATLTGRYRVVPLFGFGET